MSKLRSVSTSFWSDPFVEELSPDEKLLFLYLITNEKTNMLGIYEASLKKISFETGLPFQTISKALKRFESLRKVKYSDNYVFVLNYMKHQKYNPNMKKSAMAVYSNLPSSMKIKGFKQDESNPLKAFESLLNHLGMVRKVEVEVEVEVEKEIELEDQEIPNNKFSIFYNDEKLNELIMWAKHNHNVSISFEQIKSEAEKFVNTMLTRTDTNRAQWEYIGYFQNIIKDLKGIEPAIKKTGVRMIEARTFHPTLKDGGHFLDYVPVREVDYPAYKQEMEAKGYSIDNNRSYVAK